MEPTVTTHISLTSLMLLLLIVIPVVILFIMLCIKKPKIAAMLLLVPVVLIVIIIPFFIARPVKVEPARRVVSELVISNQHESPQSPIWSEAIENEFIADVYPSKEAAVRSIALRLLSGEYKHIRPDLQQPDSIVIFQSNLNPADSRPANEQLRDAILKLYPDISCRIQMSGTTLQNDEVEISLRMSDFSTSHITRDNVRLSLESGTIEATISNQNRSTNISVHYSDKPWIENTAAFLNSHPDKQLIIARSSESCTSAEEADRLAMQNACNQVGSVLLNLQNPNKLSPSDILNSNLIVDKFVQSFDGSAGKIWRQAMLLDVSSDKLRLLLAQQRDLLDVQRNQWVRTIFSVVGLFILITIVYAFLNAATKGYYEWSLRIAGIVIALLILFFVFKLGFHF